MSFLYPRIISIKRPGAEADVATTPGYAPSAVPSLETPVASGLPASIQSRRATSKSETGLPGDAAKDEWAIFIPRSALADGLVQNRDVIYDDLNRRFQVTADYTDSLGANFTCLRLEA